MKAGTLLEELAAANGVLHFFNAAAVDKFLRPQLAASSSGMQGTLISLSGSQTKRRPEVGGDCHWGREENDRGLLGTEMTKTR